MAFRRPQEHLDPRLTGDGLASLYAAYSQRLVGFFMRQVMDGQAAVDLMAETFAQVLLARQKFRGSSEAEIEAWVFAIARNQLAHYQRKGYAERRALKRLDMQAPVLSDDDYERIEALAEIASHRQAIGRALDSLSGDQREAVRLRVVDELAYPVIAERLGVSEPTVRARVSRGLRALAQSLESNPITPKEMSR